MLAHEAQQSVIDLWIQFIQRRVPPTLKLLLTPDLLPLLNCPMQRGQDCIV